MHQEIDAVIMGRIKDALQPLEHNWSIDKYCQDLTARAAEAAAEAAARPRARACPGTRRGVEAGTKDTAGRSTLVGLAVLCAALFLAVLVVGTLVPVNGNGGGAEEDTE